MKADPKKKAEALSNFIDTRDKILKSHPDLKDDLSKLLDHFKSTILDV